MYKKTCMGTHHTHFHRSIGSKLLITKTAAGAPTLSTTNTTTISTILTTTTNPFNILLLVLLWEQLRPLLLLLFDQFYDLSPSAVTDKVSVCRSSKGSNQSWWC